MPIFDLFIQPFIHLIQLFSSLSIIAAGGAHFSMKVIMSFYLSNITQMPALSTYTVAFFRLPSLLSFALMISG